ncbi:hypothetical protein L596_030460 [Steinernema carpocapsae]|uniref:Uncharacterized protein n=1 Tax=Steinernema carpocapsae TaxID=34508 RepID=A0A4U5LPI1_STECR|nr:hypothetical protein L596_030460 [Steinernema carpocapsae]
MKFCVLVLALTGLTLGSPLVTSKDDLIFKPKAFVKNRRCGLSRKTRPTRLERVYYTLCVDRRNEIVSTIKVPRKFKIFSNFCFGCIVQVISHGSAFAAHIYVTIKILTFARINDCTIM